MSAILGWCHESDDCAQSRARVSVRFCSQSGVGCHSSSAYIAAADTRPTEDVVRFVRIALKVLKQNDGNLVDAILYIKPNHCHYTYLLAWKWSNFRLQQSSQCSAVQFIIALRQVLHADQEVPWPPAPVHAVHRIHMSVSVRWRHQPLRLASLKQATQRQAVGCFHRQGMEAAGRQRLLHVVIHRKSYNEWMGCLLEAEVNWYSNCLNCYPSRPQEWKVVHVYLHHDTSESPLFTRQICTSLRGRWNFQTRG